ncbi:MAG: hypothetical protein M0P10_10220 [Sphaerochaetaceae bacterium]|jgi:hypothetical protein|nr:hypothetical protein [Sphaerochaetaceae bacterium]
MKTKTKISLLIILLLTSAGAISAVDTNYYTDVSLSSNGIEDAIITANQIQLPIIADYDPGITTAFSLKSEAGSEVDIYGDNGTYSVNEYDTDIYDITSDETTETFSLNFISNEDSTEYYRISIDYSPEWYSVSDPSKHTGQAIDLSYQLKNTSTKYSIDYLSSDSNNYVNPANNDAMDTRNFKFYSYPGYINSTVLNFSFTWEAKTLTEINSTSSEPFSSEESVESIVYVQIFND